MPGRTVELSCLSPTEKLRLIESIWDELSADPSSVPVEDWQRAELDRRLAAAEESSEVGSSWDEVRARITGRRDA